MLIVAVAEQAHIVTEPEPAAAEVGATAEQDRIGRLYLLLLRRVPDAAGLSHFQAVVGRGQSMEAVAQQLISSPEFRARHGSLSDHAFLELLYGAFGRRADPSGLGAWSTALGRGVPRSAVAVGFIDSAEAAASPTLYTDVQGAVSRLYRSVLSRTPDPGGLRTWERARRAGVPLATIATRFIESPEFSLRYGATGDESFVDLLYANVLGRAADSGGRSDWLREIRVRGRTSVVLGFSESEEFRILTGTSNLPSLPIASAWPTTGSAGRAGAAAPAAPVTEAKIPVSPEPARVLVDVDFDTVPDRGFGQVDDTTMTGIFGLPVRCYASSEMSISGRTMRVRFGPTDEGSARSYCKVSLPKGHDEVWLRYRVYAEPGWVPVKGGKLAGLAGGAGNTGGAGPSRGEGFSARNMWRTGGNLVQYTYHQDQAGSYGDDFRYLDGGQPARLVAGQWRTITHQVTMNTPGQRDDTITGYVDGRQVMRRTGLSLRGPGYAFGVDQLLLGGFYGGSDSSWAPPSTTYIRFDDVVVSTGPLA